MVSPCAYVVGPARPGRDRRARPPPPRRRGLRGRPEPVGAVRGRHRRWRSGTTTPEPRRASTRSGSPATTSTATGPTSRSSTRCANGCAPRGRDSWIGDSPTRDELEDMLGHDQWMIDILFDASIAEVLDHYIDDHRLKDALYGQGVIGAYAGPRDWGTASVKLMHYQGDLQGQGPVWGYVRGGMGMISFALAEAAVEAGAAAGRRCRGGRGHAREVGVRLVGGRAHPRPDGRLQRRPEAGARPARGLRRHAGRLPGPARGLADPQPGREVQRRPVAAADVPGRRPARSGPTAR